MKQNNQQYQYIITLDKPYWPRKLADELMNETYFAPNLISVTDVQNDTHIYGPTYTVRDEGRRPVVV